MEADLRQGVLGRRGGNPVHIVAIDLRQGVLGRQGGISNDSVAVDLRQSFSWIDMSRGILTLTGVHLGYVQYV